MHWLFVALLFVSAGELTGRATVIDGDTIEVRGERIRLHGIDAPESGPQCRYADGAPWPCGQRASVAFDDFLAAAPPTRCTMVDRDRWNRVVATCTQHDGADVSEWLVRQGWALDWPRYSASLRPADEDDA